MNIKTVYPPRPACRGGTLGVLPWRAEVVS